MFVEVVEVSLRQQRWAGVIQHNIEYVALHQSPFDL